MRRKEDFPLQKVTLVLYDGDFARLRDLHPRLGASKVVRTLVRKHIQEVEHRANKETVGAVMYGESFHESP